MRWLAGLILALALCGCSGELQWSKEGTSPAKAAAELADCRSGAQSAIARDVNIQSDILATRGRDWQNSGALATKDASFAAENSGSERDIVSRCMIGKGFVPGG